MSSPAERLAESRSRLEAQLREIDAELTGIRGSRSESTADDEHDPEGSTVSADWSRAVGLRASTIVALDEVEAAVLRLAEGSYGLCVNCGRPIAAGRLEARPAAALCIDCASGVPPRGR